MFLLLFLLPGIKADLQTAQSLNMQDNKGTPSEVPVPRKMHLARCSMVNENDEM